VVVVVLLLVLLAGRSLAAWAELAPAGERPRMAPGLLPLPPPWYRRRHKAAHCPP
jgi:hypothetical protein